jgi:hypothetical protein
LIETYPQLYQLTPVLQQVKKPTDKNQSGQKVRTATHGCDRPAFWRAPISVHEGLVLANCIFIPIFYKFYF